MKKTRITFAWILFGGLSIAISFYPISYLLAEKPIRLLLSKSATLLSNHFYMVCFYLHIIFGGIALLIGWLQFSKKLRTAYINLHRIIGKIYVVSVLISGIPGFYIALEATGGLSPKLGFSLGAIFWVVLTFFAFTTVKKGKIEAHKQLMMYSYAGTFGAVTLRLWLPLLIFLLGSFIEAYKIVAWLSWVPNMIVVYFLIKKQKRNLSLS